MNWILGRSTKFRLVAVRNPTYSFTCRNEVEERHLERLVQVISAEGLLKAIKMYCDWMSCHPHIIATCAQVKIEVIVGFIQTDGDVQQERNECLGSPPPPGIRGAVKFAMLAYLLSMFLCYPHSFTILCYPYFLCYLERTYLKRTLLLSCCPHPYT